MTYDYQCKGCNAKFEVEASFEEKAAGLKPECPECGSARTMQLFSPLGVISGGASRADFEPCGPQCACAAEAMER